MTFKDVAQKKMDIQSITSVQTNGTPWKTSGSGKTKCAGDVSVRKIDAEGSYLDQYEYYSTKTPQGWWTQGGLEYAGNGKIFFEPGEGFIVNNTHQEGAILVLPSPIPEKDEKDAE